MELLRRLEVVVGLVTGVAGTVGLALAAWALSAPWGTGALTLFLTGYLTVCWALTLAVAIGAVRHGRSRDDIGILMIAFATILLVPPTVLTLFSLGRALAPATHAAVLTLLLAAAVAVGDREPDAAARWLVPGEPIWPKRDRDEAATGSGRQCRTAPNLDPAR